MFGYVYFWYVVYGAQVCLDLMLSRDVFVVSYSPLCCGCHFVVVEVGFLVNELFRYIIILRRMLLYNIVVERCRAKVPQV